MMATFVAHAEFLKARRADEALRDQALERRRQEAQRAEHDARLETERLAYLKSKLEAYRERRELAAFLAGLGSVSSAAPYDSFVVWASERLAELAAQVSPETICRETAANAAFSEFR